MEFSRATVCRECWSALRQPPKTTQLRLAVPIAAQWAGRRGFTVNTTTRPSERRRLPLDTTPSRSPPRFDASRPLSRFASTQASPNLDAIHTRIHDLTASVLRPEDRQLPSEQRVLYVFEQLEALASTLLSTLEEKASQSATKKASRLKPETTATSALLGSVNAVRQSVHLSQASLLAQISQCAENIMRDGNVFITPGVLKSYVDLQAKLHQPSSFPDIFDLYSRKPVPASTGKDITAGVTYSNVSPNKINAAIDSATANAALTAAININNLPLAIDIIHTSFCAPSFKKSKILRQALIPISGLAIAPVAAYTLSAQFSSWQNTMSPEYATGLAFAGIMTYVACVGTMGYIAVTTANDQMDRVTWAQGVPLWERWIREEERAAIDRVAGAWGFQEIGKRGDEEGEEWLGLKEFVGLNGMVLDRVELMDGME